MGTTQYMPIFRHITQGWPATHWLLVDCRICTKNKDALSAAPLLCTARSQPLQKGEGWLLHSPCSPSYWVRSGSSSVARTWGTNLQLGRVRRVIRKLSEKKIIIFYKPFKSASDFTTHFPSDSLFAELPPQAHFPGTDKNGCKSNQSIRAAKDGKFVYAGCNLFFLKRQPSASQRQKGLGTPCPSYYSSLRAAFVLICESYLSAQFYSTQPLYRILQGYTNVFL